MNISVRIEKYAASIVMLAIGLYVAVFGTIVAWKYINFAYNSLDLAIINQAFFNTIHGQWFASTIHPPSYLGDHLSLLLIIIAPLYALAPIPFTLALLQTTTLALGAWPLYLLAKHALGIRWALAVALAWLCNPLVQNINLFEFSFLPFATLLLLWAGYCYQRQQFGWFVATIGTALLAREDVALVVMMFSFLAFADRRAMRWKLLPAGLALAYGLMAHALIGWFSPTGQYKFSIYYGWLGHSGQEIFNTIITHPLLIITHVVNGNSLEFILGLLLTFLFLPIFAKKYLILTMGVLAQLLLSADGASSTMLLLQYPALLLPGLALSSVAAIDKVRQKRYSILTNNRPLLQLVAISGVLYVMVTIGPLPGVVKTLSSRGLLWAETESKNSMVHSIPANAAVAASYEFLTPLSSRTNVYALNYALLGKQQYLTTDYRLPTDTEYILIDFNDLLTYQLQYDNNPYYTKQYRQAMASWPAQLADFGLIKTVGPLALYQKNQPTQYQPVVTMSADTMPSTTIGTIQPINLDDNLVFLGYNRFTNLVQFFWQPQAAIHQNYYLRLGLETDTTIVWQKVYPLGLSLLPTSGWKPQTIYQTSYQLNDIEIPPGQYQLTLQVIDITAGGIEIDSIRSTKNVIDSVQTVGPEIILDAIAVE